jgi:hypothetical protein
VSLAIAAWLLFLCVFVAFQVGRARGRDEVRAQVLRDLGPILPMVEEIVRMAESLGAESGTEAQKQGDPIPGVSPWN